MKLKRTKAVCILHKMNVRNSITKILLAGTLAATGCAAQLQSISSGQVGCPPDEIQISEGKIGFNTRNWQAACRGRTYQCSTVSGQNSTQANCTEMRGVPSQAASVDAPAAPAASPAPASPAAPSQPSAAK